MNPNLLLPLQLIEPPQIHWVLKQRLDVWIECLPIRILRCWIRTRPFLTSPVVYHKGKASTYLEMILLALQPVTYQ